MAPTIEHHGGHYIIIIIIIIINSLFNEGNSISTILVSLEAFKTYTICEKITNIYNTNYKYLSLVTGTQYIKLKNFDNQAYISGIFFKIAQTFTLFDRGGRLFHIHTPENCSDFLKILNLRQVEANFLPRQSVASKWMMI